MKTRGDSGNDISQIIGNKITFVGGDNPNVLPSCRVDRVGHSKINIETSSTQGIIELPGTLPEYEAIDNSGDHLGGTYNIISMNKVTIDSAGGGIHLNSSGNINLMAGGGLANIIAIECINMSSNVIKLNCTEAAVLNGPELYVNTKKITFINTVKMSKNLIVNGSAFINGELYVNHITGPINSYPTSVHPSMEVFFYPLKIMSFLLSGPIPGVTGAIPITLIPQPQQQMSACGYTMPHRHQSIHIGSDLKESLDKIWEEAEELNENTKVGPKYNTPFNAAMENIKEGTTEILTNALTDTLSHVMSSVF